MAGSRFMMHARKSPKQKSLLDMLGKPLSGSPLMSDAQSATNNDSDDGDLAILSHRRKADKNIHWSDGQVPEDLPSPYFLSASRAVTRSSPCRSAVKRRTIIDSEDESSDGTAELKIDGPPSSLAKAIVVPSDTGDDDDDGDEDSDQDIRPAKRRRRSLKPKSFDKEDEAGKDTDGGGDGDGDELIVATPRAKRSSPASRAAGSRSARNSARSVRQRHMELLRRRRRGEKLTESDLASASSEEENRVALYDTDPEHTALSEFEDEEEVEQDDVSKPSEATETKRKSKGKKKENEKRKHRGRKEHAETVLGLSYDSDCEDYQSSPQPEDEGKEEMDDFIDDSHVGLIGEPDKDMLRREIPLQFTSESRKPLKSHFKDAIEWLVHRRIDRGGMQNDDELYRIAWDRLDRELGGLAQSRFISSSWTPAFRGALQARPYMDSFDVRPGKLSGGGNSLNPEADMCHACGRSNHPASYMVMFSGPAYDLNTLDDVDGGGDEDEGEDEDIHGNPIAPVSHRWFVGGVCHSNAETAHDLLHWRRALKDWVEEKLMADGMLEPERLKERDEMKPRGRRALVHSIVDEWEAGGTISSLYGDFVKMLEGARAKSTKTTRFGR